MASKTSMKLKNPTLIKKGPQINTEAKYLLYLRHVDNKNNCPYIETLSKQSHINMITFHSEGVVLNDCSDMYFTGLNNILIKGFIIAIDDLQYFADHIAFCVKALLKIDHMLLYVICNDVDDYENIENKNFVSYSTTIIPIPANLTDENLFTVMRPYSDFSVFATEDKNVDCVGVNYTAYTADETTFAINTDTARELASTLDNLTDDPFVTNEYIERKNLPLKSYTQTTFPGYNCIAKLNTIYGMLNQQQASIYYMSWLTVDNNCISNNDSYSLEFKFFNNKGSIIFILGIADDCECVIMLELKTVNGDCEISIMYANLNTGFVDISEKITIMDVVIVHTKIIYNKTTHSYNIYCVKLDKIKSTPVFGEFDLGNIYLKLRETVEAVVIMGNPLYLNNRMQSISHCYDFKYWIKGKQIIRDIFTQTMLANKLIYGVYNENDVNESVDAYMAKTFYYTEDITEYSGHKRLVQTKGNDCELIFCMTCMYHTSIVARVSKRCNIFNLVFDKTTNTYTMWSYTIDKEPLKTIIDPNTELMWIKIRRQGNTLQIHGKPAELGPYTYNGLSRELLKPGKFNITNSYQLGDITLVDSDFNDVIDYMHNINVTTAGTENELLYGALMVGNICNPTDYGIISTANDKAVIIGDYSRIKFQSYSVTLNTILDHSNQVNLASNTLTFV